MKFETTAIGSCDIIEVKCIGLNGQVGGEHDNQ